MLFPIYFILSNLVVKLGILVDIHITREKILSGLDTNHVVGPESLYCYHRQDIMNHVALHGIHRLPRGLWAGRVP